MNKNNNTSEELIKKLTNQKNNYIEEQVLIGKIIRQNKNDITEYIEQAKKSQIQLTQKEIEYKNSLHYQNYIKLLGNIEVYVVEMYNLLMAKYERNCMSYNNPFIEKIISSAVIQNIGFPLPDFFYNELLETIKTKINSMNHEFEFNVKLRPIQYAKVGNIYRNYDIYIVNIQLNQKEKQKTLNNPYNIISNE